MLRVKSTLPLQAEELITRVIGCCIAVHRALGPGLVERAYARALEIELEANGIPYTREQRFPATYRGKPVGVSCVDFIVAGQVVLELKAVERLIPVNRAQLLNYLKVAHLRAGLLVNFNVPVLPDGIRRVVL